MKRRTFLAKATALSGAALVSSAAPAFAAETKPAAVAGQKPSIARIWRGRTTRAKADEYAAYLYEKGIQVLEASALGVQLLREDRADDTEFVVISYWESIEAMSRFAGPEPTKVFPLPKDPEYLLEMPKLIQVMKITAALGQH
jgi:heme-degrading monooxygenase HmoA